MGEVDGVDYIGSYKNHGFTGFPEETHWNIVCLINDIPQTIIL